MADRGACRSSPARPVVLPGSRCLPLTCCLSGACGRVIRHAGTNVLAHDLDIRALTSDGELIRELRLDPAKGYEARAKP